MNSLTAPRAETQRRKGWDFFGLSIDQKHLSIRITPQLTTSLSSLFFASLRLKVNRACAREGALGYCAKIKLLLLAPAFLLLTACGDPETGPVDVVWDRDNCERCVMALSDRHHSAQVRGGKRHKAHHFDDIGCALLWLEEQSWKNDPNTEIWVNDHRDGSWLNAHQAHYVKITHTPMNYGFSAQPKASEGSVNFETAKQMIFQQEAAYDASVKARLNKHRHDEAQRSSAQ